MIALVFATGGATLVVALVVRRLWLATPPRSVCPDCGQPTTPVSHPLLARTDRWLRRRWCAACGWAGWGRNGPVLWRKRGPVSHDSGFRWGPDRLEADFGFRWGAHPVTDAQSAAHPSGFRWANGDPEPAATTAHPSGFRWGEGSATVSPFRWAEPEVPEVTAPHPSGFRWASAPERASTATGADAGFRWKE